MAAYIDDFSAESLLVIKKPPVSAPTVSAFSLPTENNFLEDRFICFAYRYQYQNGEFSATSQFSDPAFTSKFFTFSYESFLNEGMINSSNAVRISYNTGGALVTGIELLFKEMDNPTIKVIEKIDKAAAGLGNDNTEVYIFDNQKIFTILPEYEILRLYDNVPKIAQAQTLIGNRLVYGNYVEGYNLLDRFNNPINFNYSVNLESKDVGLVTLTDTTNSGVYTIGGTSETIPDSIVSVDLSDSELIQGSSINFEIQFFHYSFSGQAPFPDTTTTAKVITIDYVLSQNFNSVHDLATSADFIAIIGPPIKTVANSCIGVTVTDEFNCIIPTNLSNSGTTFVKTASGISAVDQAIEIISSPGSSVISFQIPAMKFVDDINTPTQTLYEYYQINSVEARYVKSSNNYSLHSNRGYEIGIVYMDEFNRSSTTQVSLNNTVHVACEYSAAVNTIQVTIPGGSGPNSTSVSPPQIAPSWAKRYKFVIKPDKTTYNTIYVSTYYKDPDSNATFFLLEGENAAKVQTGDRLIVKRDSNEYLRSCTYATVLEKEAKGINFINIEDPLNPAAGSDPAGTINVPAGAYMKINTTNFSIASADDAGGVLVDPGNIQNRVNGRPAVAYPVNVVNTSGAPYDYIDYTVNNGSNGRFNFLFNRWGRSNSCGRRTYKLNLDVRARADYNNFKDYWEGESINLLIDNGQGTYDGDETGSPFISTYYNTLITAARNPNGTDFPNANINNISYQFFRNTTTNQLFLIVAGGVGCVGNLGRSKASVDVQIIVDRTDGSTIAFETEPVEALPDVWYENDLSFAIDDLGQHTGNVSNQLINFNNAGTTTPQDAIIDTGFYNCISFGNGIESYKVRDSLTGKPLNFGNRVSTTSAEIYKEAHRFADLTYSGIFNDESNVNKLNEFNLGLLNFKSLEDSFGPINKLYSRKKDILTLQEDKISYVMTGVNLLTDASGGGVLTSVPEVLGSQVPRIEEFGISSNPESFVSYGANKYFTDSKRGAVIQLTGNDVGQEQLQVISEFGMRGWFRDFFINTITNQKLGAFDPYMNEYVLATNSQTIPGMSNCLACGVTENVLVNPEEETIYCVNVGQDIGSVVIDYVIPNAALEDVVSEINTPVSPGLEDVQTESGLDIVSQSTSSGSDGYIIKAYYNGVEYTSGLVFVSGTITIPKNIVDVSEITLAVSTTSLVADTIQITTECPIQDIITIYNISVTSNNEATQTIHNQYNWTDGVFSSPLHSNQVDFAASDLIPIVSQYSTVSGPIGAGVVPSEGALVNIISNKLTTDDFVFNTTSNKFRYLRTDIVYNNTSSDILSLITASSEATPIVTNGGQNFANFTMPVGTTTQNKLYLIWDYRSSTSGILNKDSNYIDACCPATPIGPTIACGVANSYSGGAVFPQTSNITLGATLGGVLLDFNITEVPSKVIVKFDGVEVINTGYRGDATQQGALNNALSGRGLPPETISGVGIGTGTFTKSTATTFATVEVYSPLSNNSWSTTLNCPT